MPTYPEAGDTGFADALQVADIAQRTSSPFIQPNSTNAYTAGTPVDEGELLIVPGELAEVVKAIKAGGGPG